MISIYFKILVLENVYPTLSFASRDAPASINIFTHSGALLTTMMNHGMINIEITYRKQYEEVSISRNSHKYYLCSEVKEFLVENRI